MRIINNETTCGYFPQQQTSPFINASNHKLKEIESILYNPAELNHTESIALESLIFEQINHIEKILQDEKPLNVRIIKKLQILKIAYGMAAIKIGDTCWESFGLAGEVYRNNEGFCHSAECLLSADEQAQQRISYQQRRYSWRCCQYNFAWRLIHRQVTPPADPNQGLFAGYLSLLEPYSLNDDIAAAIASTRIAEKLCLSSFAENELPHKDALFKAITMLNSFYNRYLHCTEPENDRQLCAEARHLVNTLALYLPITLKNQLLIA